MVIASDWIAFHADRTPEKIALIDEATQRSFTYLELNERSARLAAYMARNWGVSAGDHVAILAKNSAFYFEFQFACIKLGAIMLPLNWRLANPELLFILNDAEAVGLVFDSDFADRVPNLLKESPLKHALH